MKNMIDLNCSTPQNLIKVWIKRLKEYDKYHTDYCQGYKDALQECLMDIAQQFPQEVNPLDFMTEKELKDYAASLDADSWGSYDY